MNLRSRRPPNRRNPGLARFRAALAAAVLAGLGPGDASSATPPDAVRLMPRVEDYTVMSWAEGFPAHTPGAPWRRVIRTGTYALALDTDTLRIPHFGPVRSGGGYLAAVREDPGAWRRLPPAELALTLTVDGKAYRATAGGKWTQFTGPRVVESGRFLQRADVTDLVFTAADGAAIEVEGRLETVAWPDRLAFVLAVRPKPPAAWNDGAIEISLRAARGVLRERWDLPRGQAWSASDWHEVALALDPVRLRPAETGRLPDVRAAELPGGRALPVRVDAARGWHCVQLDGIEPAVPEGGGPERQNDAIERVALTLTNPSDREATARLLFEKNGSGLRQTIGSPITGMSAILRHPDGQPTGIPVQLSKNWHGRPEGGVYAGAWFHGFSAVRLPPNTTVALELALVYGHWGGVAAASHAQLCLIGWGSNQQWDESALGAWGESICYEPDQVQAAASVLDVRPVMVRSMSGDQPWQWTHNVGGGDFFRCFDVTGARVPHAAMRTAYERQGPCLTEVTYAGRVGAGLHHAATVSLARTDDIVRGVYRVRLDVRQATAFSRFVVFQIGADSYSYTGERKMALGSAAGLTREWATHWGGGVYRTEPLECTGRVPWVSLHEAVSRADREARARGQSGAPGAWANRGVVVRSWRARLGGRTAAPWVAERGVRTQGLDTSTLDFLPPPGVNRLVPGDYVDATFEHIVMPQCGADYFGPDTPLRAALEADGNTWRMIHREAVGNDRRVDVQTGTLERLHPAITIRASDNAAAFTLTGGLGYVPVTFTALTSGRDFVLQFDGQPVDQSVHGRDFWQTDYDPSTKRWSLTYNLPIRDRQPHAIRFHQARGERPWPGGHAQ